MLQLIALRLAATESLQLVDQIKENKQGQKPKRHKADCANDFAVDQSA